MSLAAFLPPPRYAAVEPDSPPASPPLLASKGPATVPPTSRAPTGPHTFVPPPHSQRPGFVSRPAADFSDVVSIPALLHSSSSTAPVLRSVDGSVRYDAIVHQGRAAGVTVQSAYADMAARQATDDELARPSPQEEAKAVEETKKALGLAVEKKLAHSSSSYVKPHSREASFVRYTPSATSVHHNSGAASRLVRLTEAPVDPLQPMMLKHQKLPAAAPDAPVPLLHSPPRKLTAEDVAAWKIPPCLSNWKNAKGFTIALDKRMASDGRGLQTVELSDKFAKLSESLFVAERLAREEIDHRAKTAQGVRRKEKADKEDELRGLAEEARRSVAAKQTDGREGESDEAGADGRVKAERASADDEAGRRERDEVRRDRQTELKRSMLQQRQKDTKGGKITSLRDDDRDVSEKIALGQAAPSASSAAAAMPFDSRLFNQSEGLSGGFTADDSYNIYDKPLFQPSGAGGQYRPRAADPDDEPAGDGAAGLTGRADKPFKGAEKAAGGGGRVKPVEFEREDADPFGLGSLLNEASRSADEDSKERDRTRSRRDEQDSHRAAGQRRQGGAWEEKEAEEEQKEDGWDRRGRGGYKDFSEPQRGESRRSRSRSGTPIRHREREERGDRDTKRRRY